ncbi:MAG: insulinase family protein [Alphaproteobacteria bacterium]|nr:insulinase family protein [Alphaproteobacteria bacterium]
MKKNLIFLTCICSIALVIFIGLSLKTRYQTASDIPLKQTQDSMTTSPLPLQELKTSLGNVIWFVPTEIPVVSINITFRHSGDKNCPPMLPGLTDLVAALLDEGAGPYDSQGFKKALLEKNINLSISSNKDNFVIAFRTVKENLKDALDLIQAMLTAPRFAEEDMRRVKEQITASLQQSLHMPQPTARMALQKNVYGENHPYYKSINDRLKVLSSLTGDQLKEYMKKAFTQSNLEIIVCGAVSQNDVVKEIESTFMVLPKGEPLSRPAPLSLQNLGKTYPIQMDIPQTLIYFVQPGIPRLDPDIYALLVGMRILGSGEFESRLWQEIREKRGLAYFCSADISTSDLANIIMGATATKTESVDQVIGLIKEEWKKIIDKGVTQAELDFHKKNITGSYPLSFGSTLSIVGTLASYRNDNFPIDYIKTRNSNFEKLTVADVNKVLRRILNPDLLTFIIVGRLAGKNEAK